MERKFLNAEPTVDCEFWNGVENEQIWYPEIGLVSNESAHVKIHFAIQRLLAWWKFAKPD